jgi:hypothetical protein
VGYFTSNPSIPQYLGNHYHTAFLSSIIKNSNSHLQKPMFQVLSGARDVSVNETKTLPYKAYPLTGGDGQTMDALSQ